MLLNHNLLKSKPDDDVAILARARTLTALEGLDPERKAHLLTFLYEANLIGFHGSTPNDKMSSAIINLGGANFSDANLQGANLQGANFADAYLSEANLYHTNLYNTNLYHTNLGGADLRGANLSSAYPYLADFYRADLQGANLSNAILSGVEFSEANLSGANLQHAILGGYQGNTYWTSAHLSQQQLDQVSTCKDATLPKGLTCHHNQSPP